MAWKSSVFSRAKIFQNNYAISVQFSSLHNNDSWILTFIYGPCDPEGKVDFLDWLGNVQMPDEEDWMLVGDFNLLRKPKDRNRHGGNTNEMLLFNEVISALGIEEISLHRKKYI